MIKKGMFWHVHHDTLLEYCYDYDERVRFIKKNKPKSEQELRLRLFQPVKGKFPRAVTKAWAACDKARAAYDKARAAYDKARAAYDKAWTAYNKARTACAKARTAYNKAAKNNIVAIEKLHRKECPDCPWDGETIFSGNLDT
ncbi:hypothetical protein LCGC14_2014070 [marine sediment metagenome]|uniref:Uncharacterized protein n=1 Tax=marine sediment metagenome TaxID=412755 RepID=A0A0F9HCT5_9ZZZZ